MIINHLQENVALQYTELLQQVWSNLPSGRGISFVKKNIKGHDYWYIQNTVGARKTQIYLGADSPKLQEQISAEKSLWENAKPELNNRKKLVAMLIAGGATSMAGTEARVFESLERAGVFLAGGVVVGSHAFALYSNMLGVKWNTHSTRTQDIDIASDNIIKIGATDKQVDLKETILQSGLGFFEAPTLNRKEVSTTFAAKGKQLRVDVLTPMLGRTSSEPVYLASLKTMAQPVRFLDYLLENIQPAIIVSKSGILVNTPSPARFALHKLVVSQRRLPAFHTKSKKDINQAEQLLTVLVDERPGDILLALEAIKELPNKFNQQLKSGMRHLTPDLQREMKELMDS